VRSRLFSATEESQISHIELADWAEAFLCAPATAHVIARLAHGLADDLLTTVALATRAPLLLAPAMNVNMYRHPATQANLDLLAKRGARLVGPAVGELAALGARVVVEMTRCRRRGARSAIARRARWCWYRGPDRADRRARSEPLIGA
jgi:phosphopantothenoylcysteine synthetase/decarboxylase